MKMMMPDYSDSESEDGDDDNDKEEDGGEDENDEEDDEVESQVDEDLDDEDDEMIRRFGASNVKILETSEKVKTRKWSCRICARRVVLMNEDDCIKHFLSRKHNATAKRVELILNPKKKEENEEEETGENDIKKKEKKKKPISEKRQLELKAKRIAKRKREHSAEEIEKLKEKFKNKKVRRIQRREAEKNEE
jgi:hypothetical protein